jgi:hypothetical protein
VLALDFQFDVTRDGQVIKILHITDEFTREMGLIGNRDYQGGDA